MGSERRPCPACGQAMGGQIVVDLSLKTPDDHPLGNGYPVVSCSNCGTGYADVEIPTAYYEHYYATLAKYAGERSAGEQMTLAPEPGWLLEKADDTARRIARHLPSSSARILDFGCATGALLAAFRRQGYRDVHGVDPSPESVELANLRDGVDAVVGSFSSVPDGLGAYDCVCVTGVLEHLWDPSAAIEVLAGLLVEGGTLCLEVPDAASYLDPYVAAFEDFNTEHVNHFSFASLRHLAERHGFETVGEHRYQAPLTAAVLTGGISVAWRSAERRPVVPAYDAKLAAVLAAFTERSHRDLGRVNGILDAELAGRDQVIVWGIGEAAFKLLALPALASRSVLAYVDGNPARRAFSFDGVRVTGPGELVSGPTPIVAASLIRADSIVSAARELGLANPVIRLDSAGGTRNAGQ